MRRGHEREERVLVDDPVVERRRLEEDDEVLAEPVEVRQGRSELVQEVGRHRVHALLLERAAEPARQELVRLHEVDHPDRAVLVVVRGQRRREVEGDVRRVRPVEEACREAVVLREREPVPQRVFGHRVALGVLAKVPEQVRLDLVEVAAEPLQARREVRVT